MDDIGINRIGGSVGTRTGCMVEIIKDPEPKYRNLEHAIIF